MVATLGVPMGMTDEERDLRSLVRRLLALWGSIQRHGPLAPRKSERSAGGYGSKLLVPPWCTQMTCAFADLNPDTYGLAVRGDTAWLVHAPFNDEQRVLWATFVTDATPVTLPDSPARFQWAHEEERARKLAIHGHHSARDAAVALALGLTQRTVRRYRDNAIGKISRAADWLELTRHGDAT